MRLANVLGEQLAQYTFSSRVGSNKVGRGSNQAKGSLGYFAFHHADMPGKQTFFGQLWKEYAFSDSRYLTSDPFVLCMETVTAVRLCAPLFLPM